RAAHAAPVRAWRAQRFHLDDPADRRRDYDRLFLFLRGAQPARPFRHDRHARGVARAGVRADDRARQAVPRQPWHRADAVHRRAEGVAAPTRGGLKIPTTVMAKLDPAISSRLTICPSLA